MSYSDVPEFVDCSVFLGMHSVDEAVRRACKNFFASRFHGLIAMSFEQIGACDDFVWRHAREVQDFYYPFMDRLHSVVSFSRKPYSRSVVQEALQNPLLAGLGMPERLAVAQAIDGKGVLFSLHPALIARSDLPVRVPQDEEELDFPEDLEKYYRASLRLRHDDKEIR